MKTIFDWLPDIGFGDAFFTLLLLFIGRVLVFNSQDLLKQLRHDGTARLYNVVGFLGGLFMTTVLSYAIISNTRRDHWLRVGTARYSVGTVTGSYYSRSGRKFVFTYPAGPRRYQAYAECGNIPCPPAGTRRYVRFAAEVFDVCSILPVPVPDSITAVPALGWARLPE